MTDLSLVMTARNDDYGGNLLQRMQGSVDSILHHGERHELDGELLLVEWNPPHGASPLAEALEWPDDLDHMSVRVVTVPESVHGRFSNADRIPLFEYIAKNTGIRRAEGEFVLATNPDLIYGEALIEFFAEGRLEPDCFYRVHRWDVHRLVPLDLSVDERERFAEEHTYKYSTVRDGYVTVDKTTRLRKQLEFLFDVVANDPAKARYVLTDPGRVIDFLSDIYGNVFSTGTDADSDGESDEVDVDRPGSLGDIFLTSSGDFLLMAARHWEAMHGYPELDTNLHVDSFGCVYATELGLKQAVFKDPLKIYHQEHDRSERDTRPAMDRDDLVARAKEIMAAEEFEPLNDESWGLAGEDFQETVIGG